MIEVLRYLATFCCDIAVLAEFFCGIAVFRTSPPQSPLWLGTNHESLFIVEGQGVEDFWMITRFSGGTGGRSVVAYRIYWGTIKDL